MITNTAKLADRLVPDDKMSSSRSPTGLWKKSNSFKSWLHTRYHAWYL